MQVDPENTPPVNMYRYLIGAITPRPITWVSTQSDKGIVNLAPFSFFNGVAAHPPTLLFCPANRRDGSKKDTLVNIEQNGEFVVNVVSDKLASPMNQTAAEYPDDVDEFDASQIAKLPSERVAPPRVADSSIQIECVLREIVRVGEGPLGGNIVIGNIVLLHISDSVIGVDGFIDPACVDAVGRMGGPRIRVPATDLIYLVQNSKGNIYEREPGPGLDWT